MAWIVASINISHKLFIIYFLTYVIISTGLISVMMIINNLLNQTSTRILNIDLPTLSMVILIIFRLGGLPPLLGFIPKWLVIFDLFSMGITTILVILITGRLINLFYYFNIVFNFILTKSYIHHKQYISTRAVVITIICTASSILFIL
jgi:NADH-ubiquinone oxidoreductase chain 2